jgi:hypothetical protein
VWWLASAHVALWVWWSCRAGARRRKVRGRTWRSGHLHAMGGCRVVRRRAINPSSHRLHLEPVYAKVLRRSSRSMG